MEYSDGKKLALSVIPAMFKPTLHSGLPNVFRKDIRQLWLTKEDTSGRKINECCRIGGDKFYFCCKICRKNPGHGKGFDTLTQDVLSDEHKQQFAIHLNFTNV